MQIFGEAEENVQPATLMEVEGYPPICLVAVKRTYYIYKQVMVPANSGTFTTGQGHLDRDQR